MNKVTVQTLNTSSVSYVGKTVVINGVALKNACLHESTYGSNSYEVIKCGNDYYKRDGYQPYYPNLWFNRNPDFVHWNAWYMVKPKKFKYWSLYECKKPCP